MAYHHHDHHHYHHRHRDDGDFSLVGVIIVVGIIAALCGGC